MESECLTIEEWGIRTQESKVCPGQWFSVAYKDPIGSRTIDGVEYAVVRVRLNTGWANSPDKCEDEVVHMISQYTEE